MAITPSPIVFINGNSAVGGVNVTGGSTVTISLQNTAGVTTWNVICLSTDDLNSATTVNSSIVQNFSNFSATFIAPSSACALRFQSQVNNGQNIQGTSIPTLTTTFGIYVLTGNGFRVGAFNEILEGDPNFGTCSKINTLIRNYVATASSAGNGLTYTTGSFSVNSAITWSTAINLVTTSTANIQSTGALSLNASSISINTATAINFNTAISNPTITQNSNPANSAGGQALTIAAQNCAGTTSTGGNLVLASGTGTSANGVIQFSNASIVEFVAATTTPTITQVAVNTASTLGANMIIKAQNSLGSTSTGGTLTLSGGNGTTNGLVLIEGSSTNINGNISCSATQLGFYGITAITVPTVTGSKGSNAALSSLMTALANLGLVVNSTS